MPDTSHVALLQLLTETASNRTPKLEAVVNPRNESFRVFETDGREAVLWGSDDLIRVARELHTHGFRAVECTVVDAALDPLDDEATADISEALFASINGEAKEGQDELLEDRLFGVVLLAIFLRRRKPTSETVRLMQNGQFEIRSGDPEALVDLVTGIARGLE